MLKRIGSILRFSKCEFQRRTFPFYFFFSNTHYANRQCLGSSYNHKIKKEKEKRQTYAQPYGIINRNKITYGSGIVPESRWNFFKKWERKPFSQGIINLGIVAHIDAGKTSISEDILFLTNEIRVKGSIEDQNTQLDFLQQERERGITIKAAYSFFEYNNASINLIDTPGHVDFSNETFLSLCVCDKIIMVIDAKESVQIQTLNIFRYINERIPIFFFFNKMDIYGTDVQFNYKNTKSSLTNKSALVTIPVYENKKLMYIWDLVSLNLYVYPTNGYKYGQRVNSKYISVESFLKSKGNEQWERHLNLFPPDQNASIVKEDKEESARCINKLDRALSEEFLSFAIKKREELIETLCDLDEQMEWKYMNDIPIMHEEITHCLIKQIEEKKVFPIFSGSALHSYGVDVLLKYVTYHGDIKKNEYENKNTNFKESWWKIPHVVENGNSFKTVLFVFKIGSESKGLNTFCKVLKGKLCKEIPLFNPRTNTHFLVKQIYKVKADRYIMVKELKENDIGMIRGLEQVAICDFLFEEERNPSEINEKENVEKGNEDPQEKHSINRTIEIQKEQHHFWYFLKNYQRRNKKSTIVCKCTLEINDCKKEKELKQILHNICLEDNSIQWYIDKNNNIIMGSIGWLNIEVTLDKIKHEHNIELHTSDVEVVSKEYVVGYWEEELEKEMKVGSKLSNIQIGMCIKEKKFIDITNYIQSILKSEEEDILKRMQKQKEQNPQICYEYFSTNGNTWDFLEDADTVSELEMNEYIMNINYEQLFQSSVTIHPNVQKYIEDLKKKYPKKQTFFDTIINDCIIAIQNCLQNGYRTNENMINTEIVITKLKLYDNSSSAVAKYACNDLYYKMLKQVNLEIAEPISLLHIQTEESFVGSIVKDIMQNRKGHIIEIMKNKEYKEFKIMNIFAIVPLKYSHNYSSVLRAISSGNADFFTTFCGYQKQ